MIDFSPARGRGTTVHGRGGTARSSKETRHAGVHVGGFLKRPVLLLRERRKIVSNEGRENTVELGETFRAISKIKGGPFGIREIDVYEL